MQLCYDNKSFMSIVHNPIQHDMTKHIEIDRHIIDNLDKGLVVTTHVPTRFHIAAFSLNNFLKTDILQEKLE